MYDITQFCLRDMSECGLALRHIEKNIHSTEEVSNKIIQYLYERIINKDSQEKSWVLIRQFQTIPYK